MSKKGTVLLCFSPPVMLLTFVTEIMLAGYTIWRYKFNTLARLATAMLVFLSIFQLSEYMLCGGLGFHGIDWVRFGYISITILPPLGLHMAAEIAGRRIKPMLIVAYATMAAFIYFFVFVTRSLDGAMCVPNYAVFHVDKRLGSFYVAYYYGWLLITSFLAVYWAQKSKHHRQLLGLAGGYASFIVPTTILNVLAPSTVNGVPSIMCGFAILMAASVVVLVLPGAALTRRTAPKAD